MVIAQSEPHAVLNLVEAAAFLRVSERTLGEMARLGRVPCQRAGREWRFLQTALTEWLTGGTAYRKPETLPLGIGHEEAKGQTGGDGATSGLRDAAFTQNRGEPMHRWVPWIAGFSADFVADTFQVLSYSDPREVTLLDPFSGVGTTLVEGLKRGFNTVGFEINPFAALVCQTKLQAGRCDVARLRAETNRFAEWLPIQVRSGAMPQTSPPEGFTSRAPFFSPSVQTQVLLTKDYIAAISEEWLQQVFRLALGAILVEISNYSYEPSLGRRVAAGKPEVLTANVARIVGAKLAQIADDIDALQAHIEPLGYLPQTDVRNESYLTGAAQLPRHSMDLLVTSPPYLNNYHYVRNTRPHLFWLDFVHSPRELKALEHDSFGKFWQTVRAGAPVELAFDCPELHDPMAALAAKNPEKGVYGGTGWANYAASYFNDCDRFCRETLSLLKPGGRAFVVIGNNILQGIEFRTDEIFARIAETQGFRLLDIHLVREKRTGNSILNSSVRNGETAARVRLYETAVEIQAPG